MYIYHIVILHLYYGMHALACGSEWDEDCPMGITYTGIHHTTAYCWQNPLWCTQTSLCTIHPYICSAPLARRCPVLSGCVVLLVLVRHHSSKKTTVVCYF